MNLLVLGATGATGALVVGQAVSAGNNVTALVRSPDKVSTKHPNLKIITGQATKAADVTSAIVGANAVISTLGAPKGTVMADAVARHCGRVREPRCSTDRGAFDVRART